MPHAQELYEKYKDNPDIIILVVNTAFEKDRYPVMGDEKKVKAHLKDMGWTMPVARDKDEQCILKVFGIGTSSALLIDPSGIIRFHAANGRKGAEIDRLIEEQLAAMKDVYVPEPRSVHVALANAVKLMGEGSYAEARESANNVLEFEEAALKEAQKAAEKANEGAEDFAERNSAESAKVVYDARYLIRLIDNSIKRLEAKLGHFSSYDPVATIACAEHASKIFDGMDVAHTFAFSASLIRTTDEYKAFAALEEEYKKALEQYERELSIKGSDTTKSLALIEDIAERGKDNRIGDDARAFLAANGKTKNAGSDDGEQHAAQPDVPATPEQRREGDGRGKGSRGDKPKRQSADDDSSDF